MAWQSRATALQDQLGKRHAKCTSGATGVEQAARTNVEEAAASSRSAAVGSYRCAFPDTLDPRTALTERLPRIAEHAPAMQGEVQAVVYLIPRRAKPYVPVDAQGREQLANSLHMSLDPRREWKARSSWAALIAVTLGAR